MVGLQVLVLAIGVRIPVSEQTQTKGEFGDRKHVSQISKRNGRTTPCLGGYAPRRDFTPIYYAMV